MQLTSSSFGGSGQWQTSRPSRFWALPAIVIACLGIFWLDRSTGIAPVQHLYYLPIILAALKFGNRGGLTVAAAAIILYHLANGPLLTRQYGESDIIQIALFLAVGLVTAKLANDAKELRVLAMTDDLTGLHNLRSFEAQLVNLVRASRVAKTPLSLLVLDVDRLKNLNDQHGHLAGAEAVRTVGHIIARHVPPDGVACRYGGDEFAVTLPYCAASRAEKIAEDLCQAVNATAPVLVGRRWPAGTLSVSVGVGCRSFDQSNADDSPPTDEQEGERLFHAADELLYKAKASGRNRVCSIELARVDPRQW
jgi:diguanylate cyclase (GGDEF)-like protein